MADTPRNIVVAPAPAVYENAPCLQKVEAAIIQQGVAAAVQWELRDGTGLPIDLCGVFPIPASEHPGTHLTPEQAILTILAGLNHEYYTHGKHIPPPERYMMEVRLQPADEPAEPMWIVPGTVKAPLKGLIEFNVPPEVSDLGGIFVVNMGLCRVSDGRPLYVHRGLLCVERSAWRSPLVDCKMPTLSDIRMRIMDTDTENLLQGYVEFTTADLLDSIVAAVREWNGTTPSLANHTYTCSTFPWIEPWLNKIVASLYMKAALRYGRNKLLVSHGGVQGDDLNRDQQYQALAQQYDQQWKEWLKIKKRELNLQAFNGTVSSPYGRLVNSTLGRTR
jgi:hypothetical protein